MSLRGSLFHGLEIELRTLSGARAMRVIHSPHQAIPEHRHDWPSLTLPVLGECAEACEAGAIRLEGPSAVVHPAGAFHSDRMSAVGMESVSIQFDPAWLGRSGPSPITATRFVSGGEGGAAATRLARLWAVASTAEPDLRKATADFIALAAGEQRWPSRPAWMSAVAAEVSSGKHRTADLARKLRIHPAWLARAYRAATGEGLAATMRRKRIERAVWLLRDTQQPIAEVALESGFCDQSHMNRDFRQLLGRTPRQVRAEGSVLSGRARMNGRG